MLADEDAAHYADASRIALYVRGSGKKVHSTQDVDGIVDESSGGDLKGRENGRPVLFYVGVEDVEEVHSGEVPDCDSVVGSWEENMEEHNSVMVDYIEDFSISGYLLTWAYDWNIFHASFLDAHCPKGVGEEASLFMSLDDIDLDLIVRIAW